MSDLREMMEAALGTTPSAEGALEQTKGRIRRRQRRRTIATAATALLLSAAAIGFLWTGFLGNRAPDTAATPSEDTGSVEPVVVANVAVGDFPSSMTTGDGSIWVSVGFAARGDSVVARIDPATNEVIGTIPVDGLPGQPAIEAGSLWIGLARSVQRIDPETGRVITEIVGPGSFLTATPGAVWALDSANSIARIDPTTSQVVATVTLDLPASESIISGPVGTPDAVWVMATLGGEEAAGGGNGVLFRIDPTTNSVVARIELEMASAFAVGDGAVWVVSAYTADRTTLTRIDAATDQAASQIDLEGQWTPFAVGAGRLWLMGGIQPEILVAGLNLSTLELEEPVVVGELPAFDGSGMYDPETNTLWISQYQNSVTRVDLRSTAATGGTSTPEAGPYPRGAFEWCPEPPFLEPGQNWSEQASETALRFVDAYAAGDDAGVTDLSDPSVPPGVEFPIEVSGDTGPRVISTNAVGGSLVEFACGNDVAASTVTVTVDDGSDSASLDFEVYLILRETGWKVWAVY